MGGAAETRGTGRIPSFTPRNAFESDAILIGALEGMLGPEAERGLAEHGAYWGSSEVRELVRLAETHPPHLVDRDPFGERLDGVEYHPARHALVRRSIESGLAVSAWDEDDAERGHRHALRAARVLMTAQTDSAHLGVATTSSAVLATLIAAGGIGDEWLARTVSRRFDHRFLPVAAKSGVTLGLSLVERGASYPASMPETRARVDGDGAVHLDGHAWFLQAPMNDAFLTAARTADGPALFLVSRHRSDGHVNGLRLERLKTTLGVRGEAIAEASLIDCEAVAVGTAETAGDLVARCLQALRFDAATIAAGIARGALARGVHHVRHRRIAGEALIDQPLMARVLADATLDTAAATALTIRLAHALDRAEVDEGEAAYARLVIPAARYWIAKTASAVTAEAIECLGGNGFVEDHELARYHRDALLPGLTGGAGNTLALDVLRFVEESPDGFAAAIGEIAVDLDRQSSAASADLIRSAAEACVADQGSARILIEQVALAAAAAALHRFAPRVITEAFTDTRLEGPWRASFGMLDGRFDARGIVDYAFPEG
ncbi:DNA alkylation response protein [Siculibacillus lacustris]|uniref:DNA alkylation response protein n=1 Tax=Siculibacillus lacustris TaxID=1549641 RepID=A0A4Q9VIY4_9HYPH|nr:acyl-CoA dehydrogenase family protein [Siculibacillus lacustris]TBW34296.1 DNA alkylation response protein [Siculibacillus lacustris]